VTLLIVFVSTALIVGVVTAARAQPVPQLPDLPQVYLPGNRIPEGVTCYLSANEVAPRCSVDYEGNEIYFTFGSDMRTITKTLIPAREYPIGQIVVAWGNPTGITRKKTMMYVHWGARSALLYTTSFQPDNLVEFILYDLEPLPESPWRGFGLFE
jgi:hypothetical protein